MSASHPNVTCGAGDHEWEASNTFSMIASKVREGISRWSGHGISWPPHLLVRNYINQNSSMLVVSKTAAKERK